MDLVSSAAILALLLERSPDCPIPAAVVHDFYNATEKLNNPELAEAVYSASRTARERGGQSLPPPRGNTLMWFVSCLVKRSKNVHTARELATQLVEDKVAIPLAHCGRIIALFAVQGFASQARALWERYADSADATERRYVVGHSAAMLRLVSLFTNLSKWAHSRAPAPGSAAAISEGVSVSKNVQDKDKTENDFWAFAERVYDAFRETRQPLRRAHHFDVNALARASFILGRVTPGLAALRLLLARRSAPDLHDVNVALTLLAEHAPHAAARVVVGMARRGLRADAASFGPVIHHAAVHGDGALVGALIRRARAVGVPLSYKTLGTLLRRVFEEGGEGETREAACGRLRRVLALVDALVGVRQVPSPGMGRDCVVVALRADNARAAFRFWRLMVDGKAEWGDTAQVQLRRAIAGKVRREWGAGLLQGPGARAMLRMLGERVAAGATPTGEGGGRRDGG
ncbi:hypothetical protein IEO21_06431 [Rhodonia placenta]|uniref:Pentatricopeptide repeat-containing protein n=1 Tax=Rhodonia placenta TaxID=104341 RepID=A0A8H7U165_9APHY|nr:hypothetical protein IEO21_06431 [Postia placenta]